MGECGQVPAPCLGRWKPFQDNIFFVFKLFPSPLERGWQPVPPKALAFYIVGVLGDCANLPNTPTLLSGSISYRPLLYYRCIHDLLAGLSHHWHSASVPGMEILIKIGPAVRSSTCACKDGTSLQQGFGFGASASRPATIPCLQPAAICGSLPLPQLLLPLTFLRLPVIVLRACLAHKLPQACL